MSIILAYIAIAMFMTMNVWFWCEITKQTFSDGERALSIVPAGTAVFLVVFTGVVLNGFTGGM